MRPKGRGLALLVVGLLAAACANGATQVWQSPGPITPSSYRSSDPRVVQTIGKLRRLAMTPPRCQSHSVSGARDAGDKAIVCRDLGTAMRRHLVDWKGYEVIPLDLYADLSREKFEMSAEQLCEALDRISEWVRHAPDGEPPPPEVTAAVSRIGNGLKADGLLVLQLAHRDRIFVDIIEVTTGQVVWRSRFLGRMYQQQWVWPLSALGRLEPAIPSAVIEE
jgi:hypothetical protein